MSKSECFSSASLIIALSPWLAVIGLWHWLREPSHWQYVVQDRLAVKQLQFACEQAFPAALHLQLTIFIRSGGARGPLAITGDGTLLSHTQPNSVIQSDGAFYLSAAFHNNAWQCARSMYRSRFLSVGGSDFTRGLQLLYWFSQIYLQLQCYTIMDPKRLTHRPYQITLASLLKMCANSTKVSLRPSQSKHYSDLLHEL